MKLVPVPASSVLPQKQSLRHSVISEGRGIKVGDLLIEGPGVFVVGALNSAALKSHHCGVVNLSKS